MNTFKNFKGQTIKNIIFFATAFLLIVLISLCIKGTAHSMEKSEGADEMESYYRSVEKEYVSSVKEVLKDFGLENSGVMLTKTVDASGTRSYVLSINHRRLKEGTSFDTKGLISALYEIEIGIPESTISIMTTG